MPTSTTLTVKVKLPEHSVRQAVAKIDATIQAIEAIPSQGQPAPVVTSVQVSR